MPRGSWEETVLWSYDSSLSNHLKDDSYSSISTAYWVGILAGFGRLDWNQKETLCIASNTEKQSAPNNTCASLPGLLLETSASLSGLQCHQNVQIKVQTDDRYTFLNTFSHIYREEKNTFSRDWEQFQTQEQFYQIFQLAALVSSIHVTLSLVLTKLCLQDKAHNSLLFWSLWTSSNQAIFKAQMPQEKGNDPWLMLFLMSVSLPCNHFHATCTEDGSFGTVLLVVGNEKKKKGKEQRAKERKKERAKEICVGIKMFRRRKEHV